MHIYNRIGKIYNIFMQKPQTYYRRAEKGGTFMVRVENITVDEDQCIGCKQCVRSCPVDVLRFDEEKKKAYAAYPDECEWCLICEEHCPANALHVQPKIPTPVFEYLR